MNQRRASLGARVTVAASIVLLAGLFVTGQRVEWVFYVAPWISVLLLGIWRASFRLDRTNAPWVRHLLWAGPLAYLATVGGCIAYIRTTVPALEDEGAAIVRELERYRGEHGAYPERVPEVRGLPRSMWYGGWQYETDGSTFDLAIDCDGFTLSHSKYGWRVDS